MFVSLHRDETQGRRVSFFFFFFFLFLFFIKCLFTGEERGPTSVRSLFFLFLDQCEHGSITFETRGRQVSFPAIGLFLL
jgi:hypothetical protein